MRNAGLDEAQAGIKIAGRNINNFRYADDTTPMAESKEELKIQSFLSKVKSLLFNTVPMFVIAFLPRSRHLLISWLHSPSSVILESKKIKSATVSMK